MEEWPTRSRARDLALGLGALTWLAGTFAGAGPSKEAGALWMLSLFASWPLLYWGARRPNPSPSLGDRVGGVVWGLLGFGGLVGGSALLMALIHSR